MLIGHLAAPIILKKLLPETELRPLYASSLTPDIVDKALKILKLRENGRTYSHSLLGLGVSTVLVAAVFGAKVGRSWAIGYFGHLLCDMGGTVPWFYPFVAYRFRLSPYKNKQKLKRTITHPKPVETALVIWAASIILYNLIKRPGHA